MVTSGAECERKKFDQFAIVELMGHQRIAGHVTEESIGGAAFIRVDVPAVTRRVNYYSKEEVEVPAYTRYLGGAAIYAINPCTEEVARAAAASLQASPPNLLEFQAAPRLAGAAGDACGRCAESPCVCGGPDAPAGMEDDEE